MQRHNLKRTENGQAMSCQVELIPRSVSRKGNRMGTGTECDPLIDRSLRHHSCLPIMTDIIYSSKNIQRNVLNKRIENRRPL